MTVRRMDGRVPGIRTLRLLLVLSFLVLLSGSGARVLQAQTPDLGELDARFAQAQRDWPVPGFAVVIVKDGQTVLMRGYGERALGSGEPVDEHTLFAIASNSKAFTSASLAMLVEEEKLSWDDPVQKHLPYFQLYNPYVSSEMRIRDLLSHRSGLGTYSGDLLWYGTDYSAEEVVRRTRYVPQTGAFRASYGYSNLMFIAAGEVVAAASGMAWADFVESRILQPLGMNRTVTSTTDLSRMDNVATPHKNWVDRVEPIDWYNWDAMAAAGGIISSVSDMANWLKLQLGNGEAGGTRLFSEASSWEMWTVHSARAVSAGSRRTTPSTHFRGYGLGWGLNDDRGRLVVSHGGGYDGMFSRVVLIPLRASNSMQRLVATGHSSSSPPSSRAVLPSAAAGQALPRSPPGIRPSGSPIRCSATTGSSSRRCTSSSDPSRSPARRRS